MPPPTDVPGVRRVLGVVNYFSRFVPHFANLCEPLRRLSRQDVPWQWTEEENKSLNCIKEAIFAAPVLRFYKADEKLSMQCDASGTGMGAVLLQEGQPLAYASAPFTETQKSYAQIEKELLAIVFGLEHFHQYTYGRVVHVESDHRPLESISRKPLHSAPRRLQRLLLRLHNYDTVVEYRRGSELHLANTLSRANLPQSHLSAEFVAFLTELDADALRHNPDLSNPVLAEIRAGTQQDPTLKDLINIIQADWPDAKESVSDALKPYYFVRAQLSVYDGIIYNDHRVLVPESLRPSILQRLHKSHIGINSCIRRATDVLYWPGLNSNLRDVLPRCDICCSFNLRQQKETLLSHSFPLRPLAKVAANLFHFDGEEYLLVVDYFSNYVEVTQLEGTEATDVIGILKQQFSQHGIPDVLISDNGPQFSAAVFRDFVESWLFLHITSSPGFPQSNGKTENAIRTVKRLWRKAKADGQDKWLAFLDWRNTPSESLQSSLAQRLFSHRTCTLLPTSTSLLKPSVPTDTSVALESLSRGDKVAIQPPTLSGMWRRGTVIHNLSFKSYTVKTDNGSILRRNRRHLRRCVAAADSHSETAAGAGTDRSNASPSAVSKPSVTRSGRESRPPQYLQDYVQVLLSFSERCSSTEEKTRLKGQLAGTIKMLVSSFDGSLNVDKKDEIIEKHKSCEVQLTCNYTPPPPRPIVTFADAIEEAAHFPQRLKGKTQTLEAHLLPVEILDSKALRVCRSLDEIGMSDVSALLDAFQQSRLDLVYVKTEVVNRDWFPNIYKQVERVEKQLRETDIAFRSMCTKILPQLRRARALNKSTSKLKGSLRKAIEAAQNAVNLTSRFVAVKKKEKLMVDAILEKAGDQLVNDLADQKPIAAHCLSLSLAEADIKKHFVQKKLRLYKRVIISYDNTKAESDSASVNSSESQSDDEELAEWFEIETIRENILLHLQLITETRMLNKEGEVHKNMDYCIGRIAKIGKPRKAAVACGDVVVVDERGSKLRAVFHRQPTGVVAFEEKKCKNEIEKEQISVVAVQWSNESQLMPGDKCRITYWKICNDTDRPPDSADAAGRAGVKFVDIPVETDSSKLYLPDRILEDGHYYGLSVQIFSKLVGLSPPSTGVVLRTSRAPSVVSKIVNFYKQSSEAFQKSGWELEEKQKFLVVGRKPVYTRTDEVSGRVAVDMVNVMPEYENQIPFPQNDRNATVVLMTGESGHGKSTHINGFFNWILKILPSDPIRLLLVDDRKHSGSQSVTNKITVYRIRSHGGSRNTKPLYLIDSPGFGDPKGFQADEYVARTYRALFRLITKIDCVVLAMRASDTRCSPKTKAVLNNILHQFGVNVRNNIIALLTFADAAEPPALLALEEMKVPLHQSIKINNASFVCRSQVFGSKTPYAAEGSTYTDNKKSKDSEDFNQLFWRLYETGNKKMFEVIEKLTPVPAGQSAQVTEERTKLNENLSFLRDCIIASVKRGNRISADLDIMQLSITAPPNAKVEVTVQEVEKIDLPPGSYVILCSICTFTCHKEIQIASNQKAGGGAMDSNGYCMRCDCHGTWDVHYKEKYYFVATEKKVEKYQEEIIAKWSDNSKSVEAAILQLVDEFIKEQKKIIETVCILHSLHKRLCEIALRHNPKGILDYIDCSIAEAKARGAGSEVKALIVARDVINLSVEVGKGADVASESCKMIKKVMEKVKSVLEKRVQMTSEDRLKTQDDPSTFYEEIYGMLPPKYQSSRDVPERKKRYWLFDKKSDFKTDLKCVISVIKVLLRDGIFALFQA